MIILEKSSFIPIVETNTLSSARVALINILLSASSKLVILSIGIPFSVISIAFADITQFAVFQLSRISGILNDIISSLLYWGLHINS